MDLNLPKFRAKFIKKYHFKSVLWTIHASDWSARVDQAHIEKVLTEDVRPGDIILLHDGRGAEGAPQRTIDALKNALPIMKEKGFMIGYISGTMVANGIIQRIPYELTTVEVSSDMLTDLGWYMGFYVNAFLNLIPKPKYK